ncbi:hypothetical protein TrCOL_g8251 [Triparma columacea]|uniref:Uncharacterized protein n=1 Tax=Triparma columacea TaxID=722753 RepID=A0A9W7G5D3_9STRA|nr:hypothetical protein TrCOL_g8251 [Triparma columacea]
MTDHHIHLSQLLPADDKNEAVSVDIREYKSIIETQKKKIASLEKEITGLKAAAANGAALLAADVQEAESVRRETRKLKQAALKGQNESERMTRAHNEIKESLRERGAVLELVEKWWDVKREHLGIVVHERPQLVLNFLLQESNLGVFRRQILEVENTPQRRMTVFWQHYLKGGRTIIEYLLELTISQDSSSFIVEIKSLKEKDLHKHVRVKLKNFLTANENSVGQRALIEGELRFGEYELGQTALSLVGTIETKGTKEVVKEESGTEKQDVEIKPEDPVRKSALMTMLKHRASSFRRQCH